ncbi:hypothetical protein Pmani_008368 [Petrolisthes manimaculis]|uniref:Uncharacterized protein n=1 Tax=Petrolisthes manimaculis TaxID=1843537 RepID=A0AAE1UDZ1_9EUCA|nr:hypothetical protein Pmani_008368 [Petrolisthes manimaculis]
MDTQTTGPVVVVGTAYNIDGQEDPYNNNGGEVAVMLEVARLFMSSTNGKPRFPIIFVAFDLGSEKCWTEEGRAPGGWTFVQDWLLPHLLYKSYTFEGAIILGPIMNINGEGNGTNILQFQKGFRKFPSWLEPVPMTENINTSILCQLPIREAQHFWGATRSSNPYPLSAVVITDLVNISLLMVVVALILTDTLKSINLTGIV